MTWICILKELANANLELWNLSDSVSTLPVNIIVKDKWLFLKNIQSLICTVPKILGNFLKILNICVLYDLATPLLSMCPCDLKTYVHIETYTPVFIAALVIIPKW